MSYGVYSQSSPAIFVTDVNFRGQLDKDVLKLLLNHSIVEEKREKEEGNG